MWFSDRCTHSVLPGEYLCPIALSKFRAIRTAFCNYSPRHIYERFIESQQEILVAKMIESRQQSATLQPQTCPDFEDSPKKIGGTTGGIPDTVTDALIGVSEENLESLAKPQINDFKTYDAVFDESQRDMLSILRELLKSLGVHDSCPAWIRDTDLQGKTFEFVLDMVHHIFFEVIAAQHEQESICLPSCKSILSFLTIRVLEGCIILFIGSQRFMKSDLYQ